MSSAKTFGRNATNTPANVGSRSVNTNNWLWNVNWNNGGRGRCESLFSKGYLYLCWLWYALAKQGRFKASSQLFTLRKRIHYEVSISNSTSVGNYGAAYYG